MDMLGLDFVVRALETFGAGIIFGIVLVILLVVALWWAVRSYNQR